MRHGNGQSRAEPDDDREVTAERELLPQVELEVPLPKRHGMLGELVSSIWRMLRGMGVSHDDVAHATRVSLDSAFAQLASQVAEPVSAPPSSLAGLPIENVIDPLLVAAYRAASSAWRSQSPSAGQQQDQRDVGASTVRFQGELLVLGLLGTLDEAKRSCLLLADMERLSSPEIAALTGLRLDVVYDELRKARKAFERARKAGATLDAETDTRELLALARVHFSPAPAALDGLCGELAARFEALALRIGNPSETEPGPSSRVG